jgi:hypothetical protein
VRFWMSRVDVENFEACLAGAVSSPPVPGEAGR